MGRNSILIDIGAIIAGILLFLGMYYLIGWLWASAWNYVAPLFWQAAPVLTVWQALVAMLLLSLIAGAFKSTKKGK